jgi:2Fe-2S ferredoxin
MARRWVDPLSLADPVFQEHTVAMGGINPYIKQVEADLPKNKYRITFVSPAGAGGSAEDVERIVEVDPTALPYTDEGLPGSVLDIACGHGIDIDHACGGVAACSTCHVLVEAGGETCNEISDAEEDMLDLAPGLADNSRLGCQVIPDGTTGIRVVIPTWNRNRVSEEH